MMQPDANTRNLLLVFGATILGGLMLTWAYDRYTSDSEHDWFKKKRATGFTKVKKSTPVVEYTEGKTKYGVATPTTEDSSLRRRNFAGEKDIDLDNSNLDSEKARTYENIQRSEQDKLDSGIIEERTTITKSGPKISGDQHEQRIESSVTKETIKRELREIPHQKERQHKEESMYVIEAEGSVKRREREAVIQEVVHPVEVEEIQPIIHRERKLTEVHQVTQPIYEERMLPPTETERELIPEHLPTQYESREAYMEAFEGGLSVPSVEYNEVKKITLTKEPIIEEVIKKDIIEVIQPVIHRQTVQPVVVKTKKPIFEKIKEQPVLVREVRDAITLSTNEIAELTSAISLAKEKEVVDEEEVVTKTTTTVSEVTEVTKEGRVKDVELLKVNEGIELNTLPVGVVSK